MKNRRLILVAVAFFVIIEISAVTIGVWPIFFYTEKMTTQERAIRIGIAPIPSRSLAIGSWDPILKQISHSTGFHLVPYYAYSDGEIEQGLSHGRLDLAYTTPLVYYGTEQKTSITPLLAIDLEDQNRNRAVLATRKDMDLIKDTRNSRLTFVDKHSFSGYFIPERYLREKIPVPLTEWFSSISFAGTHAQAVADMMRNKTDIVATNWRELDDCASVNGWSDRDIRIIWTSYSTMPRNIVCVNRSCVDDVTAMKLREAFLTLPPAASPRHPGDLQPVLFSRCDSHSYEAEIEKSLRWAITPNTPSDTPLKELLK